MKKFLAVATAVLSLVAGSARGEWPEIATTWHEIQKGAIPYTDPATGTMDIRPGNLVANNVTVSALATPTVTSVTPVLTKIGSITTVAGSALVDGDYFTIKYASGLTVPIQFDLAPGDGATGGMVPYVFTALDTADQIRDGLITLLNSAAGTALTASSGGAATISLSLKTPGAVGDTNTENVTNAGFAVTGFVNPTAATTYGYKAVSYLADGTSTAASAEVTTAAGHATLSSSNYVRVVLAPSAGSVSTRLYRTTGGAAPPKLIYTGTATTFDDVGAAGTAQTPATTNTTGQVLSGDVLPVTDTVFTLGSGTKRWAGAYANGFIVPSSSPNVIALTAGATGAADAFFTRIGAATWQLGAAAVTGAVAPVAQTLTVQSVGTTATADLAGSDWTHKGSFGKGTAASGKHIFTVGTPQLTTTPHVSSTVLTLQDTGTAGVAAPQALFADGTVAKPSLAMATFPTNGFSFGQYSLTYSFSGAQYYALDSNGIISLGAAGTRTILTPAAAATLQLGAAASATPVSPQTLRAQGGLGADKIGSALVFQGGIPTGTGIGGSVTIQTTPSAASTSSTAGTPSTRYTVVAAAKTLTLGSATDFVNVNFPASSTVTVAVGYNVQVSDSAATPEFKSHGGRYYISAYRKATGNAVAGTVVETGDASAQSVGNALTDAFTVTGTATGITIAQNVTVGTGLTAPNVGLMTYDVHVHGNGQGIAVVPIP